MQLPPTPPPAIQPWYASPRILFVLALLGAYGAFEGILRLVRTVPKWWSALKARWKSRIHDEDFYFSYRETGVSIHEDGLHYHYVRHEKIVARKRLEEVPLSYGWSGQGPNPCSPTVTL